ncbi:MAG: YeeE/YedE family protein [Defluviicoccus sp.]
MQAFTPFEAVAGGSLIGLAAVLLMLANGRIAGISGIVGGLMPSGEARPDDIGWRMAFISGLIGGPGLMRLVGWPWPDIRIEASVPVIVVAGFLVGFGARIGSGCTSGHGVCGLARGSRRSLVATVTFMLTAAAVVFVIRHRIGV